MYLSRLCACGCGGTVGLIARTQATLGRFAGQPWVYLHGHHSRLPGLPYDVDAESGCWVWNRCRNAAGYGVRHGATRLAHRWMWERVNGPIQGGMELDHLCRNRACVSPEHLEPVSHAVNTGRAWELRRNALAGRDR